MPLDRRLVNPRNETGRFVSGIALETKSFQRAAGPHVGNPRGETKRFTPGIALRKDHEAGCAIRRFAPTIAAISDNEAK